MFGFKEALRVCHARGFSFKGRASRSEYWWAMLGLSIAGLAGGFIAGLVFGLLFDPVGPTEDLVLQLLLSCIMLALTLPVCIRRFHDSNLSGWLWLVLFIACFSPVLFGNELFLAVSLLTLIIQFVIGVKKGAAGPNKYGTDPLAPGFCNEFLMKGRR